MTSTHPGVDVAATSSKLPYVALLLGILSVPGSILTWDTSLPGEGFVWGLPLAVAAVVAGYVALRVQRRRPAGRRRRARPRRRDGADGRRLDGPRRDLTVRGRAAGVRGRACGPRTLSA